MEAVKKTALPANDVRDRLAAFPEWGLSADGTAVSRRYRFKNFRLALTFTNEIGEIAEAQKHHPDIMLGWGYVGLTVQSHDAGGITERDFRLIEAIDAIVSE